MSSSIINLLPELRFSPLERGSREQRDKARLWNVPSHIKPVCLGIFHEGMSGLLVGDGHEPEQGGSEVLAPLTRRHRNCLTLFTAVNETSHRSLSPRLGPTQSGAWTARSGDAPSQFRGK